MAARTHQPRQRKVQQVQQGQPAPGVPNQITIVTCRVDLPESLYDAYAALAARSNIQVEDLLLQQLSRCRDMIGSGIYFNESQKKRLSNVVGHTVADAEGALQRLETSTIIDVSGFKFELDPRLVQRLKTRVFRGEEYSDVMHREIVRALMTFAGMSPSQSNTGGWWRRPQQGAQQAQAVQAHKNGHNGNIPAGAKVAVTPLPPAAKEATDAKDPNLIP